MRKHVVSFWERGQNEKELIPICEPTPFHQINTDPVEVGRSKSSKETYKCLVLESHEEPIPRECRRLLKRGYAWSLSEEEAEHENHNSCVDNKASACGKQALEDLLVYRITFEDKRRLRSEIRDKDNSKSNTNYRNQNNKYLVDQFPVKCTCYFSRNRTEGELSDSFYLADDRCIILAKFSARTLKLCYLDLLNGKTYFQKLVLFHITVELRLCNGLLWLVQKPSTSKLCEILYIRPNDVNARACSNCIVTRHTLSITFASLEMFLEKAVFSSTAILFKAYHTYVRYDSQRHCLREESYDIPEIDDSSEFYTVGKMFLAVQRENVKSDGEGVDLAISPEQLPRRRNQRNLAVVSPRKQLVYFYTGVFEPELKLRRKIDISRCLSQHENYLTPNFEVSVHHRGMKALLLSEESYILVLDLLSGKVTQILSYIPCFWQHKLSLQMTPDGDVIKMIGSHGQRVCGGALTGKMEYLCVDFLTWHGASLREICMRKVARTFDYTWLEQQKRLPRWMLGALSDSNSLSDEIVEC